MTLSERTKRLFEFVGEFHAEQVRKYTNAPYTDHLIGVAQLVSDHVDDPLAVEIALCHDLYEDTQCNMGRLDLCLRECGYERAEIIEITVGVMHLTDVFTTEDYPHLNRESRKKLESERLGKIDSLCQSIKYADMIDNMKDLVQYDPKFSEVYLSELRNLLDKLRYGNIDLFILCSHKLMKSEEYLRKFHGIDLN